MTVRQNTLVTITTNPQSGQPLTLALELTTPVRRGVALQAQLVASGGTGGYIYSTGGTLPPGCGPIDSGTGIIAGTPATNGDYIFTGTVQDSSATVVNATFAIDVSSAWFVIHGTPQNAQLGRAYQYQFTVADAAGAILTTGYTIAPGLGSPPTGLTLSGAGLLSGTPSGTFGTYAFTVRCTSGADSIDIPCTMKLTPALSASAPTVTLAPSYTVGVPVSIPISVPDGQGRPPYRVSITSNALPVGLSIVAVPRVSNNAGGVIARVVGTPTAITGTSTPIPVATITDASGDSSTLSLPIKVGASTPALAAGQVAIGNTNGDGSEETIDLFALFFGGGGDGALVCDGTSPSIPGVSKTGNVYKLGRDVYLTDLTISGVYSLDLNSYALNGSGTLDLSGASAGALFCSAPSGGDASGITGGAAANGGNTEGTLLLGSPGTAGASTGNSAAATAPDISAGGLGWAGLSSSGYGGTGFGTAGHQGAFGVANRQVRCPLPLGPPVTGAGPIAGGVGGPGGGAGANGTLSNKQGAGGGGGQGGPVAQINFRKLKTNASTASGAIAVIAGDGGKGADNSTSNAGAGGGGMGGAGGYLQIRIAERIGSPVTKLAKAVGGDGGDGGTNSANATNNGHGSDGAMGGLVELINVLDCTVTLSTLALPITASGTTGGMGAEAYLTF